MNTAAVIVAAAMFKLGTVTSAQDVRAMNEKMQSLYNECFENLIQD